MINKTLSQKGSAHVVIIIILVVALLGALGFIFWQNYLQKNSNTSNSGNSSTSTQTNNKKALTQVNEDDYSFTVVEGFKESPNQMFTHTASLKALKTFVNDRGDYFEILTTYGDGGGISADYFWNYSVQQGNTIVVEKLDRCTEDSIGCAHANNTTEGIIVDKNKTSNYYLAFGNQQKNDINLEFVDEFISTFRFK